MRCLTLLDTLDATAERGREGSNLPMKLAVCGSGHVAHARDVTAIWFTFEPLDICPYVKKLFALKHAYAPSFYPVDSCPHAIGQCLVSQRGRSTRKIFSHKRTYGPVSRPLSC